MGRRTKETFFKEKNASGQQAHEKVLNMLIIKEMKSKSQ